MFFSKILPKLSVNVEVLVPELKKHGILLDESIMSSLDPPIDELHYVMYRLGKKENGLQIFYRCLRETQDEFPDHRRVADRLEVIGKNNFIANINSTLITCFNLFIIIMWNVFKIITGLHSGSTHREFNNYGSYSYHLCVFYHRLDHCGVWMIT